MIQIDTMVDLLADQSGIVEPGSDEQAAATRADRFKLVGPLGTISGRITLAAISVSVTLVALGVVLSLAFYSLASRNEQGQMLADGALASSELTASISDTRYYSAQFADSGDTAEIAKAHETLDEAKQRLATTRELAEEVDREMVDALAWLEAEVQGFEGELTALERSVAAYGPSVSARSLAKAIDINGEQLANNARSVEARLRTMSATKADEIRQFNTRLTLIVVGLAAIIAVLAALGFRFLARDITGSLGKITKAMTGLAEGDKSILIPGEHRQDEIGEMARALVVFRKGAEELAEYQERAAESAKAEIARREDIKQARIKLTAELAAKFDATVGNVVNNVATASSQLEDTANAMASSATQSSNFANDVAKSMDGTSTSVTAAASATDQFSVSIGEISQQAGNSATLAREARITAERADGTIASLSQASEQIGAIVEMIRSIAERTNLLALNASIEAARGGEAGRGFAVVAAEVKELANRTSQATDQVAGQIREIQDSSKHSVSALKAIEQQIRQVEANASTIAQSVDEQSVASQELARNLDLAAEGTGKLRTSIGEVRELSLSTGSAATQVLDSAKGLRKQAIELRLQVDEFLGFIRAA